MTIKPEPEVKLKEVVPFTVDKIPPCKRPELKPPSNQRRRVVFVKLVPG